MSSMCIMICDIYDIEYICIAYIYMLFKAATVQIFFGSALSFDVGFRLFWFGSISQFVCISHPKHVFNVNLYISSTTNIKR